ncbi:MAG: carbohydrate ABC transporter permease [Gemmatimonadota bacterium]|jgi:multiple sugar transport system permease protein
MSATGPRPTGFLRSARSVAVVGAAALWLLPALFVLAGSLKPDELVLSEANSWRALWPSRLTLSNYADVLRRVEFGRILLNSLVINVGIVGGGLVVNSLGGYALARLRFRGRAVILAVVLALLVVPLEAIAVPLFYQMTVLGGRDTYWAQVLPFVANAFSVYLFYTFFLDFPRELEEAARVDGAGTLRTFVEIVVPNSAPAFASVTIVTLLLYWGLYLWPLMITSSVDVRPLPLGMASFRTLPPLQWGDIMAFAVMMVAPAVLLFLVLQRWFVAGIATVGVKR